MTQSDFNYLIAKLEKEGYHIIYSREEGWAYVSYKQHRKKIEIGMSLEKATDILLYVKPVK